MDKLQQIYTNLIKGKGKKVVTEAIVSEEDIQQAVSKLWLVINNYNISQNVKNILNDVVNILTHDSIKKVGQYISKKDDQIITLQIYSKKTNYYDSIFYFVLFDNNTADKDQYISYQHYSELDDQSGYYNYIDQAINTGKTVANQIWGVEDFKQVN